MVPQYGRCRRLVVERSGSSKAGLFSGRSCVTKRRGQKINPDVSQHMARTKTQQLLNLLRRRGAIRAQDLSAHGIPRVYLHRLHARGVLERPTRGLYVLADAEPSENQSLVEACRRVPHGVVCLLSALRFHGLTTQAPFEVWLAIDEKARRPKLDYPPLRIVRFSKAALSAGVKNHNVQGVTVRVTEPARTVVDCFKYRNKIGLDVALEALRDCRRQKKATMDELHRTAQARRMANVMRPYLESLA
jgi:predicted transcriptional regulator of viral defense system